MADDDFWTFGGGPAERLEDAWGELRAGVSVFVRSAITGRPAEVKVETGPNGRIPAFTLPREWEWSSVEVSVDATAWSPLGQARELQNRPATVLHLREVVEEQEARIGVQRDALRAQDEQICSLLSQLAASQIGGYLPLPTSPDAPDLPAPSDPVTGDEGGTLPLPGGLPLPTDPADPLGGTALPIPEGP